MAAAHDWETRVRERMAGRHWSEREAAAAAAEEHTFLTVRHEAAGG